MKVLRRVVLTVFIQLICSLALTAENAVKGNTVTVNISKIESSEGQIILCIYDSSDNYDKRKAFQEFKLKPEIDNVTFETQLPDGEYLVMLVQDINNNGKLDTSFIGMPKETVGLSNYDGKVIPGKFKKHKFSVTEDMTVSIPLKSF